MGGNGRYFFDGSLSMAFASTDGIGGRDFPAEGTVWVSSLVSDDWWRVGIVRLAAQKEKRKRKSRRGSAGCEGEGVVLEVSHARTLAHHCRRSRGASADTRHESGR